MSRVLLLVLALVTTGCLGAADDAGPIRPEGGDFAVSGNPDDRAFTGYQNPSRSPDPRLNVEAPWHEGDWWYWTSNHSRWIRSEVIAVEDVDGEPQYHLRTERGRMGKDASLVYEEVFTSDFRLVNRTAAGFEATYDPPHPGLRFLPGDATFRYNESGVRETREGPVTWNHSYTVRVVEAWPLHTISVPAGEIQAGHFRVSKEIVTGPEDATYTFTERWYAPDVRHDAQFRYNARSDDPEMFRLVNYQLDGKRYGWEPDDA